MGISGVTCKRFRVSLRVGVSVLFKAWFRKESPEVLVHGVRLGFESSKVLRGFEVPVFAGHSWAHKWRFIANKSG